MDLNLNLLTKRHSWHGPVLLIYRYLQSRLDLIPDLELLPTLVEI